MPDPYPACARCGSERLDAVLTLCVDSDPMSDSYMKWSRCLGCDARYIADVKEEVNMGFDSDGHMIHRGRSCDSAEWDRTLAIARRCPLPNDARCTCPAHTTRPVVGDEGWYRSW